MNRKKLGSGMLALALVGLIGVGGSLAWFTDTDSKQNSFTLNHVEIGVTEDKWSGPKEDYVPGTPCDKNPTVNIASGSSDAWVRIKPLIVQVDKDGDGKYEEQIQLNTMDKLAEYGIESLGDGWSLNVADGYFYYNQVLTNGDESQSKPANVETTELFKSITLPITWGNEYTGAKVILDVTAEAVQADNTGDDPVAAFAMLGNAKIEEYKVAESTIVG